LNVGKNEVDFGARSQDCHRFIGACCFDYAASLLAQLIK
jgi:hypothetical protein